MPMKLSGFSRRNFLRSTFGTVTGFALSGALSRTAAQSANPDASPIPDPVESEIDQIREKAKSTAELVEAEARGIEMWDAELNRVYQLLQKQLPQTERKKLIDSQRAWLGFRDANRQIIRAVYERAEGSMYRPMAVNAELEIVKERAEDLRRYLEIVSEAWPEQ